MSKTKNVECAGRRAVPSSRHERRAASAASNSRSRRDFSCRSISADTLALLTWGARARVSETSGMFFFLKREKGEKLNFLIKKNKTYTESRVLVALHGRGAEARDALRVEAVALGAAAPARRDVPPQYPFRIRRWALEEWLETGVWAERCDGACSFGGLARHVASPLELSIVHSNRVLETKP